MATEDDCDVPETGAIFTFGKSKFGDNSPCKFWLKNDQVSRVCCGDEHTALVTENGRIFMFGSNEWGQLGLGHVKTITKPTRIKDKTIKEEKVKLIGCGRHHTILATEGGKLYSFGGNNDGQLGLGAADSQPVTRLQYIESLRVRNFKMLSCGAEHSGALTEDGKLYMWGGGSEGQLGLGQKTEAAEPTLLPFDEAIVYVACGYYHTAFVTESGKLYTFGETDCGKLGQGEDPPSHREAQVVQGISGRVVSVACGGSHTVAITAAGSVYTFGDGSNGQLGHGTTILVADTPQELSLGKNLNVKFASCGENSTSLITDKGQLYTFGDGRHGKLALGEENFANQFTPSLVPRFANFTVQKVSCGGCHMLAIAKVRTQNGVKEDWEDSEEEDDLDTAPSNNFESSLRKSADLSGGSLDLSGSIAARNRRREKLPDPMGTMNRTLPPLNSTLRGLPPLGQTQPLVDDTLSKKTLPQIHKLEELELKSAKPVGRDERKMEDTEEEESSVVSVTEESSEEEEEKKKPALIRKTASESTEKAPQPKPRAMLRKSREEDEESGESGEDEEDEESEDEEEEKMERKKHSEEEKIKEVDKAKVKPQPASRKKMKEKEKKSEDSEDVSEEETDEEEDEDSEEDVTKKKLSKKRAAEEEKRKKKADKKEKEKKKKQKAISVFGRKRITQASDDNDSTDDDDDDEEEEDKKQKKSKGAKDKNDKKKTKQDKNKKSDENSEDDDDEEEDEDDEDSKKTKNKEKKSKKGKKKTKVNESDDNEEDEASDEEEADEKEEKKAKGTKEVEEKQSKTCTIL